MIDEVIEQIREIGRMKLAVERSIMCAENDETLKPLGLRVLESARMFTSELEELLARYEDDWEDD